MSQQDIERAYAEQVVASFAEAVDRHKDDAPILTDDRDAQTPDFLDLTDAPGADPVTIE